MISSALTAWAELFYPKGKKVQQDDIVFLSICPDYWARNNKTTIAIGTITETSVVLGTADEWVIVEYDNEQMICLRHGSMVTNIYPLIQ